ncbi:MAG: nucleotide exchange factor GrpE [Candidatus Omnitrophota bacterium]
MTEQEDKVEISYRPEETDKENDEIEQKNDEEHDHQKSHLKKKITPKKLQEKLQEKVEEQEKLLEAMSLERDDFKDKYLRTMAEIDNFRKRVKKEKEEYQKYVLSEFLLDILHVYDNLERALKSKTVPASEDAKSIISGVEMIHKQFNDALKKYNVIEIDALNKPFDPNLHQALSKEEQKDITVPIVVEVYQKGFMYNGKLLKPVLAKVAVPVKNPEPEPPSASDLDDEE